MQPGTYSGIYFFQQGLIKKALHSSEGLEFMFTTTILHTVKSGAVDRSTIQFWNFLAKGYTVHKHQISPS